MLRTQFEEELLNLHNQFFMKWVCSQQCDPQIRASIC